MGAMYWENGWSVGNQISGDGTQINGLPRYNGQGQHGHNTIGLFANKWWWSQVNPMLVLRGRPKRKCCVGPTIQKITRQTTVMHTTSRKVARSTHVNSLTFVWGAKKTI